MCSSDLEKQIEKFRVREVKELEQLEKISLKEQREDYASLQEVIVGVNKYKADEETDIEVRDVDNQKVRSEQIERLNKIKTERNEKNCMKALKDITEAAKNGSGFLVRGT